MRGKATIAALRRDLEETRSDMWELAHDAADLRDQCKRLQYVIDRQDITILALWSMVELAEKEKAAILAEHDREADDPPSDCISTSECHDTCTASYAEGCGAYLAKAAP